MPEQEQNTAEPLEESQDNLEEEVGNETDVLEPEDFDEEYREEPEDDSQEPEEPADKPVGGEQPAQDDQRFQNMETQMSQMSNTLNQLTGILQGQQQRQPQQNAPAAQPPPMPDLESMTQTEMAQFVMGQAGQYVKSQLQNQQQMFARQMGLQGELLNVLIESHPNKNAVREALQMVVNNPGIQFNTALQNSQARLKVTEFDKVKQENERLKTTSRSRANKAKRGNRPRNARGRKTKFATHADAFDAALDEAMT